MKKVIIILLILAAIAIAVIYFAMRGKEKVEYVTAVIKRGQLTQTVSETGTVKAFREIELNFLNTGKIAEIMVKVGDQAKKEETLAELDYSGLLIKQREAEANLAITRADLAKLLAGASPQEIAVSEAGVSQAYAAYQAALRELEKVEQTVDESVLQAEKNLSDLKSDSPDDVTAYEQAIAITRTDLSNAKKTYQQSIYNHKDSALTAIEAKLAVIVTALDAVNTVMTDEDAEYTLSSKKPSLLIKTTANYNQAAELKSISKSGLIDAQTDNTNAKVNEAISDSLAALNKTLDSLDYCFDALEYSITSSSFTQAKLDALKAAISAKITTITTAIAAVQTEEQDLADAVLAYETNMAAAEDDLAQAQNNLDNAILDAENDLALEQIKGEQQAVTAQSKVDNTLEAWEVAKTQLNKTKAPARSQDVSLAQAKVKQAGTKVDSVKNQINDSIITAPMDGTVTQVNYEMGEQTSAAKPVITMLGENDYEIEVLISETDIAKVNVNNPAEITLDALGDDVKFAGKVYFIEPAETIIQDVIYYKVKVNFINLPELSANIHESNIKSGMTANVIITTAKKEDVLLIPNRAIVAKNGGMKYARLLAGNQMQETLITVGMRGDGGMVEVLSGVKEGDVVVTYVKEKK